MEAHRRRYLIWRLLSVASAAGAGLAGCQLERANPPGFAPRPSVPTEPSRAEPTPAGMLPATIAPPVVRPVRVLIVDAAPQFRLRVEGPYVVVDGGGAVVLRGAELPSSLVRVSKGLMIGNSSLGLTAARVICERPGAL